MPNRSQITAELLDLTASVARINAATRPAPLLELDLSLVQLRALAIIERTGPMRVGAVAATLGRSANATTAVLDRLEELDFVQRRPDPADRRAVLVEVTEDGQRRLEELFTVGVEDFGELLAELTTEELAALHQGMAALERVLRAREAEADTEAEPPPA